MLTGTPVMRGVHGGNIKGYIDIVRITKNIYEASDAEYWMDPEYLPIGLSGDFGAFNNQPEPRFTEQPDGQMVSLYGDDDYPYDAFEPADHDNPEGALTG
ncbi:MAG: hypothetical protein GY699_15045, partial [Desulfobacteraceae bacterium]|nr:hypothetical protein [Desulfobacteraceae bacterium]